MRGGGVGVISICVCLRQAQPTDTVALASLQQEGQGCRLP